jgi:hypothetical protein
MKPQTPLTLPPATQAFGRDRYGNLTDIPVPSPPPMRAVTKGWWVWRERDISVEEVERENRTERERERQREAKRR